MKYANHGTWVVLSGGTRRVVDGAKNIGSVNAAEDANKNIQTVAAAMKAGKRYPSLIAVESENGSVVLVEGHTRATAHLLVGLNENIELLLGTSTFMKNWAFY